MARTITSAWRTAAHSTIRDEVDLVFLTITHPSITTIRVVWDTVDFVKDGFTFSGFPFDLEILTDDETAPTANLVIQNISPTIGDGIRVLPYPPRVKIELCLSTDFNLTVNPRTEIGSATEIYEIGRAHV